MITYEGRYQNPLFFFFFRTNAIFYKENNINIKMFVRECIFFTIDR